MDLWHKIYCKIILMGHLKSLTPLTMTKNNISPYGQAAMLFKNILNLGKMKTLSFTYHWVSVINLLFLARTFHCRTVFLFFHSPYQCYYFNSKRWLYLSKYKVIMHYYGNLFYLFLFSVMRFINEHIPVHFWHSLIVYAL